MIFLTLGTHPQQFDRLVKEVDELVGKGMLGGRIFAQIGHSSYIPKNFNYVKFLSLDEFNKNMAKASLIITHAGEGNIGTSLQLNKKMIIVPRLKKFNEHTNDHQLELAKAIEREGRGIVVYDVKELSDAFEKAETFKPKKGKDEGRIMLLIEEFVKREKIA